LNKDCEDEANCNGLTYGLYCFKTDPWFGETTKVYVPPRQVCDNYKHCDGGEDEVDCTVDDKTKRQCIDFKSSTDPGKVVPVHNYTRCSVVNKYEKLLYGDKDYFENLKYYQTNCTDPERVGLVCNMNGCPSKISKYMICYDESIQICDDHIESQCPKLSQSCHIHKHLMCDKKIDCIDQIDEQHPDCRSQTEGVCVRRFGERDQLTIPLTWIRDGIEDCKDGSDEKDIWPTCGKDKTHRFVTNNETCENVFVCLYGDQGFVKLKNLCDGIETCGNENIICK
jgi:hypothetical protein